MSPPCRRGSTRTRPAPDITAAVDRGSRPAPNSPTHAIRASRPLGAAVDPIGAHDPESIGQCRLRARLGAGEKGRSNLDTDDAGRRVSGPGTRAAPRASAHWMAQRAPRTPTVAVVPGAPSRLSALSGRGARLEDDLGPAVVAGVEMLVGLGGLLERQLMRPCGGSRARFSTIRTATGTSAMRL